MGVAAADASDAAAAETDAGDRLGVPANQLPIPVAVPVAEEGAAATFMAVVAALADASPAAPGGKVRRTPAVDEPGVTTTVTSVAFGYWASIADCTVTTSAVVSTLENVI